MSKMKVILHTCKTHGITEHYIDIQRGRKRCKKCNVERVAKYRQCLKKKAVQYMGGCCQVCGYDKYEGALEFHHKNPEEKDFSISGSGQTRSWERVKVELDKCIMVCSNCHKEIHAGIVTI